MKNESGTKRGTTCVEVGGRELHLRPWALSDHLDALDAASIPGHRPLRIDPRRFSIALLRRAADLREAETDGLEELALWWALGGAQPATEAKLRADGELRLTCGYARIRPWTWRERRLALSACVELTDGQAPELDAVDYLRRQVDASVVEVLVDGEPSSASAVTGRDLHTLLDAVLRLNSGVDGEHEAIPPAVAAATRRICREYGWTPAQVDAAPAAEIDAMLRLLEPATAPTASVTAPPSGLARFPDAVIIEIEGA